MIRNIIFIMAFIFVYGGLFVLMTGNGNGIPIDTSHAGKFTESDSYGTIDYVSPKYGITVSYNKNWIVINGESILTNLKNVSGESEIEYFYSASISELDFLGGFTTPGASARLVVKKGGSIPKEYFNTRYIDSSIEAVKNSVLSAGGKWLNGSGYVIPAKDSNVKILICYYDFTVDGIHNSSFSAQLDYNGNAIYIDGAYDDENGLSTLMDLVKNRFYVSAEI